MDTTGTYVGEIRQLYTLYWLELNIRTTKICMSPLCVDSGMDRKLYPRALVVNAQTYPTHVFLCADSTDQHPHPTHVL